MPNLRRQFTTIVLASGILASWAVDAGDQYKVAIPPTSTLTQAPQADNDARVDFRGQTTLQVRYRFLYDSRADSDEPELVFMPDEQSLAHLTYLIERQPPDRPTEIFVRNPEDAARALLGEQLASQLKAGKDKEALGTAIVVIGEFSASYDCDSPTFTAHFVSLEKIIVAASAAPTRNQEGC